MRIFSGKFDDVNLIPKLDDVIRKNKNYPIIIIMDSTSGIIGEITPKELERHLIGYHTHELSFTMIFLTKKRIMLIPVNNMDKRLSRIKELIDKDEVVIYLKTKGFVEFLYDSGCNVKHPIKLFNEFESLICNDDILDTIKLKTTLASSGMKIYITNIKKKKDFHDYFVTLYGKANRVIKSTKEFPIVLIDVDSSRFSSRTREISMSELEIYSVDFMSYSLLYITETLILLPYDKNNIKPSDYNIGVDFRKHTLVAHPTGPEFSSFKKLMELYSRLEIDDTPDVAKLKIIFTITGSKPSTSLPST